MKETPDPSGEHRDLWWESPATVLGRVVRLAVVSVVHAIPIGVEGACVLHVGVGVGVGVGVRISVGVGVRVAVGVGVGLNTGIGVLSDLSILGPGVQGRQAGKQGEKNHD